MANQYPEAIFFWYFKIIITEQRLCLITTMACTIVLVLRTKSEQNSGWGAQSFAQGQVSLEDTAEKDI